MIHINRIDEFVSSAASLNMNGNPYSYKNRKLITLSDLSKRLDDGMYGKVYYTTYNGLVKAVDYVINTRFKPWADSLNDANLLKKHQQRAVKTTSRQKLIATMYAAFDMYGKENSQVSDKIIRMYMDTFNYIFELSDEEITDMFFE